MNLDKTMETFQHDKDFIKGIDIHDFIEGWGDEICTAGFVIDELGQIVLYTGARINKDDGSFEYGNFGDPGADPEAFIPGVSTTALVTRTQDMTDDQAKAIQAFVESV